MSVIEKTFGHKLRLRVSGVCIHDNAFLMIEHKNIVNAPVLWAPPGGGMNYGETVKTCLKREFKEEVGLDVEVGELLFVNEYLNEPLHAVELFFEIISFSGTLRIGTDPELNANEQLIKNVKFMTVDELNLLPHESVHSCFRNLQSVNDLKNNFGFRYKN